MIVLRTVVELPEFRRRARRSGAMTSVRRWSITSPPTPRSGVSLGGGVRKVRIPPGASGKSGGRRSSRSSPPDHRRRPRHADGAAASCPRSCTRPPAHRRRPRRTRRGPVSRLEQQLDAIARLPRASRGSFPGCSTTCSPRPAQDRRPPPPPDPSQPLTRGAGSTGRDQGPGTTPAAQSRAFGSSLQG